MLKSYNGLTEQMFTLPFRDMLYSIYNFAVEDGYVQGLKRMGYPCDVEDLEFVVLNTDGISGDVILGFKQYFEKEVQNDNVVFGVVICKGKKGSALTVIKPKSEDILNINKK